MHLFLTGVLPFLAHDHASAAAFLTCRHHNFHASIIPEFLSNEERARKFCEARQQNELEVQVEKQYKTVHNLFVQTPLMQFSPALALLDEDSVELILKPLLETKYFTRTLQRCSVVSSLSRCFSVCPLTVDLLQALSKVQSLTDLDLGWRAVENEHLETIINSFPSLKILTIRKAHRLQMLDPETAIDISSPPPPATKTLRSLTMCSVDSLFATRFVSKFINLRKLELSAQDSSLDLLPLSSSLPDLTDLYLKSYTLENVESLQNLVHLSSLQFHHCEVPDLSFLTQEDALPDLTTLCVERYNCSSSFSFAPLSHNQNLHVLQLRSTGFDNDCLQYLEDMVHLRKLKLSSTKITGKGDGALHTLIQNLFQLEELNLKECRDLGNQGAIAGALYSTHSRLRVLSLDDCNLVNDDLKGIDALENTLEVLDLGFNGDLTNEALVHCKDLVKLKMLNLESTGINDLSPLKCLVTLKKLKLYCCHGIDDLSPLKDCLNLEDLDVSNCDSLTDASFKVFSEEPNSFQKLRVLDLSHNKKLTKNAFEHLKKNNHLVYQLKELNLERMSVIDILSSSLTARNNLCQLKGLRRLNGIASDTLGRPSNGEIEVMEELVRRLKNLEEIF